MVFIINGVDVEDYSWPYLGPIPRDYVSKYQATPNTEPRTPHSPVQRVIFGNDPFEFRSIDPSTVDQPFGPLEIAPDVLAPSAAGRPAAKPSPHGPAEPGNTSFTVF
ncbi:hypothetical protein BDZ89DRAFT_1130624 [Hymenopellis radicata]|nr:hypothetical protein BDZ89DRAFT_1130624 [Hymenopellis radicata]